MNLSTSGFWKINNTGKEYTGDLYLNKDEGAIVMYIRIPNRGVPMSYLELPLVIAFITGSTINGEEVTLVNCSRIRTESKIGKEEIFGYSAQFMFNGVKFKKEEEIAFSKMTVTIPGIIQWGNVSNYSRSDFKEKKDSFIDLKRIEPIEIYSNKLYTLSYDLTYNDPFNFMEEEITLKQKPYLIIESQSIQSIGWFIEIVEQMKRLLEISIGIPLSYGSMSVETPGFYYEFEEGEKHTRPLEVLHAYKKTINSEYITKRIGKYEYLFNLSELRSADFSKWQKVANIMEPIIELYIESLYNKNLSASRHFLNMVQALETYHSRRIANSLNSYKRRVEKLLETRPKSCREDDKKFLLGDSKNFVYLKGRLADLILADYKFWFYTGEYRILEFPEVIATTRNYYIHYNQKLEDKALDGHNLITVFHILRNILEYYLLKEFGFKEEFIHKRIRERIKPIITNIDIRKADERKNNRK